MNLIIDIGNTTAKAALFDGGDIVEERRYGSLTTADTESILTDHPHIEAAILCSVGSYDKGVDELLSGSIARFVQFGAETPVPIGNAYATPATLGSDRLAAAVGAVSLYGADKNLLIVDFGSAITVDTVLRGTFMGGNISPGASMRFRALADYTAALPLCSLPDGDAPLAGSSTHEAIEAGVVRGITGEIAGYIEESRRLHGDVAVIFTGGDANYFAGKLKNTIFVNPRLVVIGLNVIFENIR